MSIFWPIGKSHTGPFIPQPWFIAVQYAQWYQIRAPRPGETIFDVTHCHTGLDFNLPNYADSNEPVRAMADGIVRFADDGARIGWPSARQVVVIEHPQFGVWTRTAHLKDVALTVGQAIAGGVEFGRIGDYGRVGKFDDHAHFDIAVKNLGNTPGDWPGKAASDSAAGRALTERRVRQDYVSPLHFYRWING